MQLNTTYYKENQMQLKALDAIERIRKYKEEKKERKNKMRFRKKK